MIKFIEWENREVEKEDIRKLDFDNGYFYRGIFVNKQNAEKMENRNTLGTFIRYKHNGYFETKAN